MPVQASPPPVVKQSSVAAPIAKAPLPAVPLPEVGKTTPSIAPVVLEPVAPQVPPAVDLDIKKAPPIEAELVIEPEPEVISKPASVPNVVRPMPIEPSPAKPDVSPFVSESSPTSNWSSEDDFSSGVDTSSSPIVGVLEEPDRFYTSSATEPAVLAVPSGPQNFAGWVSTHKWSWVVGLVLAWGVLAGIQRIFHPYPMLRSYTEEMELQKKIKAYIAQQTGQSADTTDASSKEKDQTGSTDKTEKSQSDSK
jgi:hypothetical protein